VQNLVATDTVCTHVGGAKNFAPIRRVITTNLVVLGQTVLALVGGFEKISIRLGPQKHFSSTYVITPYLVTRVSNRMGVSRISKIFWGVDDP